jgi:GTP-binding protein
MNINSATFIASSPDYKKCPQIDLPEFAFIGRSNVGKSSLINMLTGRKSLAKVSGTPGKTRLINHFLANEAWYIVDLPGIGFAKISKSERTRLESMIEGYLLHRKNLKLIFLLVDSRHEPQKIDLDFMAWLIRNNLSFALLFTKSDKLSKTELSAKPVHYKKIVNDVLRANPEIILTSATSRSGRSDILDCIEEMLNS